MPGWQSLHPGMQEASKDKPRPVPWNSKCPLIAPSCHLRQEDRVLRVLDPHFLFQVGTRFTPETHFSGDFLSIQSQ